MFRIGVRRLVLALWLSSAALGAVVDTARAADPANKPEFRDHAVQLAAHYVEATVAQAQAAAAAETLDRQKERLSAGGGSDNVIDMLRGLSPEERRTLEGMLERSASMVVTALERDVEAAARRRKQLTDDWRELRTGLYHQQLELYEVLASQKIAGQLASLLSVDNRWFWLFGLISIASLAAITLHERRHELRRWLHGGRARALGLSKFLAGTLAALILMTLITFILGDRVYLWLLQAGMGDETSPHQRFVAENADLDKSLAQATSDRDAAQANYRAAFEKWKNLHPSEGQQAALVEHDDQQRRLTVRLAEEQSAANTVAEHTGRDLKDLESAQAKLADSKKLRDAYVRQKQWIRGGLGGVLLGLAATGGVVFKRGVRIRKQTTRETCPLCLGHGTFEPVGDVNHQGLEMARCKNVISEHPYEECDFTFSAMYRQNVKLCFPTLGIPQAGKTHWLAMVYRELNRGNYPNVIQFERIRSTSSDDFDVVVDEILNKKLGPMATQVGRIPHPLIFNFLDHDPFGVSNVLVNIFDYSGEVIRSQTIEDRQRQRALDGDGFFFFLDPTEPSETQSQALAGFREDLRRIKGVRAGKQVHVPIALCVSKLDLMVNESYADPHGGGAIEKLYRDLGELGWEPNVATIEARSKLMGQLRDTVWPGWQIERQIDDLFGGRFLFFPLSPVGLDGLGERDLTRRTIAPVGLLEPLLWLLHMNGYPVLA
ncbi:MAG TPA: hypothetical protein VHC22_07285 [Pirellulales bacterium]|nr:hypothetical protein [Pirellulales bacterium]